MPATAATLRPPLDIVIAAPRGFCAGVDRAIEIVKRAIELLGAPIYVRHEVVHNRFVVDDLKQRGAVFVEDLDEVPDGALSGLPYPLLQALRFQQDPRRLLGQHDAGRGQLDGPARPLEQGHPERLLEGADLLTDRRLGDVQPLRGPAEVQLGRDGQEHAEVPELEVHRSPEGIVSQINKLEPHQGE